MNNPNEIIDPMLPTTLPGDDFESMNRAALLAWEERQRRQRTLRTLMMLLMFLLLMDGEEPPDRRNARLRQQRLRNQHRNGGSSTGHGGGGDSYKVGMYFDEDGNDLTPLQEEVFQRRRDQDDIIRRAALFNPKSKHYELIKLNNGKDVEAELMALVRNKMQKEIEAAAVEEYNDETATDTNMKTTDTAAAAAAESSSSSPKADDNNNSGKQQTQSEQQTNDELQVFHYPRNATGYYRGIWQRMPKEFNATTNEEKDLVKSSDHSEVSVDKIYPWVKKELDRRKLDACVLVLPQEVNVKVDYGGTNSTATTTDTDNGTSDTTKNSSLMKSSVSLTRETGRVAIQLYSHVIPAMNEISVVDGLVKLFDGASSGFVSRQTDVLLRVRGVMIHGIGKMSLVTTFPSDDKLMGENSRRSVFGVRQVGNYETKPAVEKKEVTSNKKNAPSNDKGGAVRISEDVFELEEDDDIDGMEDVERHRRLQETVDEVIVSQREEEQDVNSKGMLERMAQIRDDVMTLYAFQYDHGILDHHDEMSSADLSRKMESAGWTQFQTIDEDAIFGQNNGDSVDNHQYASRRLQSVDSANSTDPAANENGDAIDDHTESVLPDNVIPSNEGHVDEIKIETSTTQRALGLSAIPPVTVAERHTFPFPYTRDDRFNSVENAASPVLQQKLPPRDQFLEENVGNCEFTMDFDIQTTMWTYGEWRKTMDHRFRMEEAFNPLSKKESKANTELLKRLKKDPHFILVNKQVQIMEEDIPQESLVFTLSGNIESTNCDFASYVNATAMRTNWEKTTAKAINYSFYMMIACLTQIVVLLRQLLHTQAHSVASNVSLLCIGWQTVLDAMLCISHIFLCLVLQPLFTAFASVAFFKLLIFCVIEMKYMAIIIQARNSVNNTGTTQEQLRQQITLLHLKFYVSLMLAITLFWYVGQSHKTLYVIALYSFWVPQICWNIYSEYKKPMHHHYIYGMSLTRAIAPLYVFAVKNNFLKEVNSEFPTDLAMCEILIAWIVLQTAILIGQSKYGTRFMIPQRFLPPKFDYSRPIPAALLPRPPSNSSNETATSSDIEFDPTTASGGTRNRRGGGNRGLSDGTESMSEDTGEECTLDCVICYNEIDVTDNKGYMLAPCDHIFHRECLEQWMDVKMECPICRTSLPAL
mmetsp:Transcript_19962/g.39989  ORF Transcript_19962/g.39989 Transcript_19962/m.39989 type:complete len:1152 (-) Transcript_19962:1460-4915(-)